jgi:DNA-binding NtrC family response regulator
MSALAVQGGLHGCVPPESLPGHIGRGGRLSGGTLGEARTAFERQFVRDALARAGGHRGQAAQTLGISRQGLAKLIKRLSLDAAG